MANATKTTPGDGASSAALTSLGQIASDEAVKTIISVLESGDADAKLADANAAKRMTKDGRSATALLDAVRKASVPKHVKAGAVK